MSEETRAKPPPTVEQWVTSPMWPHDAPAPETSDNSRPSTYCVEMIVVGVINGLDMQTVREAILAGISPDEMLRGPRRDE